MPNLVCPVQDWAGKTPNAIAIIDPLRTYTYRDYADHVAGAVAKLHDADFREGDTVALLLPPEPAYAFLLMACFRMGVRVCPVNPRFPAPYVLEVLNRIRCQRIIVSDTATLNPAYAHLHVFSVGDCTGTSPDSKEAVLPIPEQRPATIVLTSGSAGPPKAALLSYGNLYHNAYRSNQNIPMDPGDRWLMSLPLYHVAGLGILFRCMLSGATVVFPDADAAMETSIVQHSLTHVSLVATQLHRLMASPENIAALKNIKAILLGGGPMPESLLRRAHAAGWPLFSSYGLTEMATQVTTTRPGDSLDRLLTAGRPLCPGTLRLSPDGEIQVAGDTLFLGYVEGEALTRTLTEDGWFATRDLGMLDEQGCLRVTGRKDNMFIAGGENIQPEEIEERLCQIEGVVQAVVVPVGHPEFGTTPVAFLRLVNAQPIDADKINERLAQHLPKYKIPRHYFPLPETDAHTGAKIQRRDFAARAQRLILEEKN